MKHIQFLEVSFYAAIFKPKLNCKQRLWRVLNSQTNDDVKFIQYRTEMQKEQLIIYLTPRPPSQNLQPVTLHTVRRI